jgi:hypothetical protein
VTASASEVTQNSATLNATVNPNGATVSECQFERAARYHRPVPRWWVRRQ